VPGLDWTLDGTWTTPSGKNWIRDFLPKKFEYCQIVCINLGSPENYTSKSGESLDTDGFIYSLNLKLRAMIVALIDEAPIEMRASIILIAHGLGGVLLKEVSDTVLGHKNSLIALFKTITSIWTSPPRIRATCTPWLNQLKGIVFLGR
jgi:hypothetical protein